MNTIEDYRNLDKNAVLNQVGRTIWEAINDGTIYSCPSLLASLCILCYADLKKYKFTYLFGFPALHSEFNWSVVDGLETTSPFSKLMAAEDSTALVDEVQTWKYSVDSRQRGFFLAKRVRRPRDRASSMEEQGRRAQSPTSPGIMLDHQWIVKGLESFEDGFFRGVPEKDQYICFADPSSYPDYPAWILRNLLFLIEKRWKLKTVQILSYRDTRARRHEARSLVFTLQNNRDESISTSPTVSTNIPKISGWEKNSAGKVTSKIANLGGYMDPAKLADQAVDLNLQLIKWRIAPKLDLDIVKNTKCLLLGAGTLGSYVSRNLLGWGVRKITFVDNGTVSYSNPVRQPLFNFVDCQNGGVSKAIRAAEALREIYPGVQSEGHVLSVPMAGHPVIDQDKTKEEFDLLKKLIDEHDVIFLLMDTRESRWLPTVMGRASHKLVMNAALGFDTFVVMRHGAKNVYQPEEELGCYFCNDVVAPADSMKDRTLDQQCTVTRPGIAAIASALLVELMVSVLQHPEKARALAPKPGTSDTGNHPLGLVPHTIRGYLSTFSNMIIKGRSYDCCSACSDKIVDAYEKDGWAFVQRAINEKGYIEDLSGLAEVQRAAEKANEEIDWSEGESETIEEEGELL